MTIKILDIIHRPVFYLKHDISDAAGFCLRLQVEPTQVGPIDRAGLCRRQTLPFNTISSVTEVTVDYWKEAKGNTARRMASSGMLRRVALVRTDVSEEPVASFIRVTRISELGKTLAVTRNRRTLRRNTAWYSS
jgi:hypothetical protein